MTTVLRRLEGGDWRVLISNDVSPYPLYYLYYEDSPVLGIIQLTSMLVKYPPVLFYLFNN